jgi:hypothetical protein
MSASNNNIELDRGKTCNIHPSRIPPLTNIGAEYFDDSFLEIYVSKR